MFAIDNFAKFFTQILVADLDDTALHAFYFLRVERHPLP